MQKFKKILAVGLTVMTFMAMSITSFAASGISKDEQKVLDAAYAVAQQHGVASSNVFQGYYSQAESYLAANDLTAAQCKTLTATVNEAAAKIPAGLNGVDAFKNYAGLEALKNDVFGILSAGAKEAGIKLGMDASGKITVTDAEGNTVATTDDTVKQTGMDMNVTVSVIAALAVVLAVCGVAAKKKGLFANAEA